MSKLGNALGVALATKLGNALGVALATCFALNIDACAPVVATAAPPDYNDKIATARWM